MQSYDDEIEKEAAGFITEQREMLLSAIIAGADFDYNEIENLDQLWHESIVDRSYTAEDAIYILDNCENEEDGMDFPKDYRDGLSMRAAYSFANDVWFKTVQFYDEIKERFKELMDEDENNCPTEMANQAFNEFESREGPDSITPVERNSDDERRQLGEWLNLGKSISGYWFGYPLGSAYIDSRCGSGHGMPDVKEFVDFDHETAKRVPWMAGKRKEEVQVRFDELTDRTRPNHPICKLYGDIDKSPLATDHRADMLVDTIWGDKNLSLANIREITRRLNQKANS
jgi:hypothetical protein